MAEARLRAELLTSLVGSGHCDRRQSDRIFKALDPLAEPRQPRLLRMEDVKAFFVPMVSPVEDRACETSV